MIIYLIKCNLSMGITWAIYHLLLADKKTFLLNRFFLLIAIIGSTIAPFISLPMFFKEIRITESIYSLPDFNNGVIVGPKENITVADSIEINELLAYVIIIITIILTIRFFYRITNLMRLYHSSYSNYIDGIRVTIIDDKRTPFSFFNVMYLDRDTYKKGIDTAIFLHEKYHIKARHSVDRIVVEFISVFLWANPFLHLLKRDLIDNLEYAADAYAMDQTLDIQNYLSLILSKSTPSTKSNFLLQRFSHSSSIKRIKMITTNQNKGKARFRLLAFILLLGCLISCADDLDDTVIENKVTAESKTINSTKSNLVLPPPALLLPVNRPLTRLLRKWTDEDTFGIWIDNIKVQNSTLISTSPSDFSYFAVIEVSNDSENYGKFRYKVHLLTNNGYRVQLEKMQVKYEASKKKQPELYDNLNEKAKDSKAKRSKVKFGEMGSPTPPPPPVPALKRPSTELLHKWANNDEFKITIDGESIDNQKLNQFNASDFSLFKVGINKMSPADVQLEYRYKVQLLTNNGYITFKSKAEKMIKKYNKEFSTIAEYR